MYYKSNDMVFGTFHVIYSTFFFEIHKDVVYIM